MIGKTVKTKDPYLIQFFYPSFQMRERIDYSDADKDILYVGKSKGNTVKMLEVCTGRFINTVGVPDFDLDNREDMLEFVYREKFKEVPKKVLDSIKDYSDEEFITCIKTFWITGRWVGDVKSESSVYELYQLSVDSLKQCLSKYFELIDQKPARVVEASFLTFIARVYRIEDQNVSPAYQKLLKRAYNQYYSKIKSAVYKLALRKDSKEELAFIDLITDLR